MAVEGGLASAGQSQYRYDLRQDDKVVLKSKSLKGTCIPLPEANRTTDAASDEILWEFKIQTQRDGNGKWSKWVKAYVRSDNTPKRFTLVGVQRQE